MRKVLVFTCEDDLHCDFVAAKIRDLGGDIIRINSERINSNLSFKIDNSESHNFRFTMYIPDSEITFYPDSYDSIWYRKPLPVDVTHQYSDLHISKFINSEFSIFLNEFYELNINKYWVNNIWANKKANLKLSNLNLANKLGLNTPKTIVTNSPLEAEDFAKLCLWKIIVKPFRVNGFKYNNQFFCSYSNKVEKNEFVSFQNTIRLCPTLLQEYIEKKLELRVTIVGENIFTVAIHSQENHLTIHDYRADDFYNVKHSIYDLPDDIKAKLIKFNRVYNLAFSTFDIILTPQNEYVFLECNPNGQWYWLEEMTQLPISLAMAKLLLQIEK